MNKKMMLKIADAIEKSPGLYDQGTYGDGADPRECGTPCCIAGWAVALSSRKSGETISRQMSRSLGISHIGLDAGLFAGEWPREWFLRAGINDIGNAPGRIPVASEAAAILREMVKDGEFWRFPSSPPFKEDSDE